MVVFSDKLFSDEDIADIPVLDNEDWPVSALQVFTNLGVRLVPPDIDRIARINDNEWTDRSVKFGGFPW